MPPMHTVFTVDAWGEVEREARILRRPDVPRMLFVLDFLEELV